MLSTLQQKYKKDILSNQKQKEISHTSRCSVFQEHGESKENEDTTEENNQ